MRETLNELSRKLQKISHSALPSYDIEKDVDNLKEKVIDIFKQLSKHNDMMDETIEADITLFDKSQDIAVEMDNATLTAKQIASVLFEKIESINSRNMTKILAEISKLKMESESMSVKVKAKIAAMTS